jgi:hypothetical protein
MVRRIATKRVGCLLIITWAACLASAWGQGRYSGPGIGYAYPAGGKQGTTFRVVVGGQLLRGAKEAYISGEGARAKVLDYIRPLNNQDLADVAYFLREMVRMRWSARVMAAAKQSSDPPELPDHPLLRGLEHKSAAELARLRAQLFDLRKQPNMQIAEQVTLEVTLDPGAAPGDRNLRLLTPSGLTNPVCFQVGVLPEVREEDRDTAIGTDTVPIRLPVLLNGQILPGTVDHFPLQARKGQQLVFRVAARRLVPYLADAVPGWFQATVALHDADGREIAHADDFRFDQDPVLFFKVPADGVYDMTIRDSIYRGREDFVYRIAVGELPFITQTFPLGGPVGTATVATIGGWNLPTTKLELDTTPEGPAIRRATLKQSGGLCNDVPYAVGALPETLETEPNDTAKTAQKISLPLIVNGRIGKPGDVDMFRFTGKAGDEVVAEVYARRLNSPVDSVLRLEDAKGHVVGANDDHTDPEMGLITHQADSYLSMKLPQDGEYRVCLSDAQSRGGDAYAYRLRISPPQPDFAVRVTPSGISLSAGRTATLTARAVRKDGFAGDIELALKDAPTGYTLTGGKIVAGKDSADMRVVAPKIATLQTFVLQLEAQAKVGDVQVIRPVVPAEDMMQAFAYRHLVPQPDLLVAIPAPRSVPAVWRPLVPGLQLSGTTPVQIPSGGMVRVQMRAAQPTSLAALHFTLAAAPRGIMLRDITVTPVGLTLTLEADGIIAQEGDTGNVLIDAAAPVADSGPTTLPADRRPFFSIGILPAIPLQVVRR